MASETVDGIVDINVYSMQLLKETCPGIDETEMKKVSNSLINRAEVEVERREKVRLRLAWKKKLEAHRAIQSESQVQLFSNSVNAGLRTTRPACLKNTAINEGFSGGAAYQQYLRKYPEGEPRSYLNQQNPIVNGNSPYIYPVCNQLGYQHNGRAPNVNLIKNGSSQFNFNSCQSYNYQSRPPNSYPKRKRQTGYDKFISKRFRGST